MELSDARDKLKKREDEVRELKMNLNTQLTAVSDSYNQQVEELTKEREQLEKAKGDLEIRIKEEIKKRREA